MGDSQTNCTKAGKKFLIGDIPPGPEPILIQVSKNAFCYPIDFLGTHFLTRDAQKDTYKSEIAQYVFGNAHAVFKLRDPSF